MKDLFFRELKQNFSRDLFKKYFHGEKDEKVFHINIIVEKNLFLQSRINIYDK